MTGLTDYITENAWVDSITIWYVLTDDACLQLEALSGRLRQRGQAPVFSDSEVITVGLIIDTWFHGNEEIGLAFVRQYHRELFPHLLSNGQFNVRRRMLGPVIEQIRCLLQIAFGLIDPDDSYRIIDSAPIPICGYGRAARNQTAAGPEFVGLIPCKKSKFFGFRLQASISINQVVDSWVLTPAARKDGKMMQGLFTHRTDLIALADNAYRDPGESQFLRSSRNIQVWAAPRKNSRQPWPNQFRHLVRRLRLRIETAFSVLVTVFHIQQPSSHSLSGLLARTASRLLAYTLSFITTALIAARES